MTGLSQSSRRPEKLRSYPKQVIFYVTQNKNMYFPRVEKNLTCDNPSWICTASCRGKEH